MVLRGLHTPSGPRPAFPQPQKLLSAHISTLSDVFVILDISPCSGIFRVSGIQDPCAGAGSYHAQWRNGFGGVGQRLEKRS